MDNLERADNLTDQAITRLRAAILGGELKPGELYSATQLGEWLGVSRTPVREAVQQLAKTGLVVVERNKGIRIQSTTLEDLIEGFQVRLMLEVPVTRQATAVRTDADVQRVNEAFRTFQKVSETDDPAATLRADRDFHLALLTVSGNQRVVKLLEDLRNVVLLTGVETVPKSRSPREAFEDHRDIYEAFVAGEAEKAGQAMRRHILNTARMLVLREAKERRISVGDIESILSWT
ncbi:GntR family transcriptional regulator [Pseudarthrobacter sp. AL07]|uniref:GntR family transcriptional regulator n=1 Tax=unclassified Pseudarthrobacter TaxID=2647000 RepID=UPI00249B8297|nr:MULTISPECIES: GntR family transcriptional regulator [unclassified Pseudarthrobacter]MDI3195620.1 GntR family transcriptional regulator [Pseudarthrobacter sp. AL20]MDI3209736.1 GntR family transcriptional regulator [Pseudarthrobacter sp. AL07]